MTCPDLCSRVAGGAPLRGPIQLPRVDAGGTGGRGGGGGYSHSTWWVYVEGREWWGRRLSQCTVGVCGVRGQGVVAEATLTVHGGCVWYAKL